MSVQISTASVPRHNQLEYWREAICSTFIHLDIAPVEGRLGRFSGKIIQHAHPILQHAEVIAEAHQAVRSMGQIKRMDEDYFMVLIQRSGSSRIEQDGRTVTMQPGQFTVCDSTRMYNMVLPTKFHHEVIKVPGSKLRRSLAKVDKLTARPIDGTCGVGRFFLNMVSTCRAADPSLNQHQATGISDSIIGLLSLALDSGVIDDGKSPSKLELYHKQRIREVLNKRLFDPELNLEAIANEVQLSSRYVHQLFSSEGTSLTHWIWQERLNFAKRKLTSASCTHESITDIAFSVGFKDAAHFSRMFKAAFDCSPREYRRVSSN
jgi:AraC-like DNA-binding protein